MSQHAFADKIKRWGICPRHIALCRRMLQCFGNGAHHCKNLKCTTALRLYQRADTAMRRTIHPRERILRIKREKKILHLFRDVLGLLHPLQRIHPKRARSEYHANNQGAQIQFQAHHLASVTNGSSVMGTQS